MRINGLVWDCPVSNSCSVFVKSINRLFEESHRSYKLIQDGFQLVVGSGENVRFWHDVKWNFIPLKIVFPRIYALAINKDGMVRDFGRFEDSKWKWEVSMRRELFDWEIDQWNCFLVSLESINIWENFQDAVAWSYNPNGMSSFKSFKRHLENNGGANDHFDCPFLWKGICPPKVEIFLWQLLKGKVLVRGVLNRFGMSKIACLDCPLCGRELKSINHLFLQCGGCGRCVRRPWDGGELGLAVISQFLDGWKGGLVSVRKTLV
ncbi:hypothetical protein Ddye_014480 [Dipteronia dyeriana]|uniref:Reverse transcriptase zinc-binding domain-containing protein n=1 Tax=Dipteronia dyeriana TaxID=168575 RepID=A0AAE0CKM9_9ROSI|nr:hypothetical protein Ddye_014480 [Dipteronia dyeriana]